jgi:hypothetical protein
MQQMSTRMQQNQIIEWRRAKVMELLSKGKSNQLEIARLLEVSEIPEVFSYLYVGDIHLTFVFGSCSSANCNFDSQTFK